MYKPSVTGVKLTPPPHTRCASPSGQDMSVSGRGTAARLRLRGGMVARTALARAVVRPAVLAQRLYAFCLENRRGQAAEQRGGERASYATGRPSIWPEPHF